MKLHNTLQNEAILSNVGEIGEFRIRNSAKAFNILSSGLYANKIRAIVRELSCNAVDSHTAAGKTDTPFDVHLPNAIEPWFSIRDYGTGLNHEQVTNIYTTYFESTKTNSNEFIGALGLGSKSPFSYTDNFTVTTVKDGRKGVYTAFINEAGVPSIALMAEEETTDPNGVEVRFAVESTNDFYKFRDEASRVYTHFKLRPVVSGYSEFKFRDVEYKERDIISGVHTQSGTFNSVAIMGNIAYPIDVPNADKALGDLHSLLGCGLVMEFDIGELDFQASREGLSYIPETIAAIKAKLEKLNGQLATHIAERANKIENLWERSVYLVETSGENLWRSAILEYVNTTKFDMVDISSGHYVRTKNFQFTPEVLASKYNILLRGFTKARSEGTCKNKGTESYYNNDTKSYEKIWSIGVYNNVFFVVNDTKVGCTERAKFHWKNTKPTGNTYSATVFVIEPADKTKSVDTESFFKDISSPKADHIMKASSLLERQRAGGMGRNVSIMRLERRNNGGYQRRDDMVWRDAGKADSFDSKFTYYYLPLSGYNNLGVISDVKTLNHYLERSGLFTGSVYGVRKSDIEDIKKRKNWVNLDEYVHQKLSAMNTNDVMGMVKSAIDFSDLYRYNAIKDVDVNSPYLELYNEFKDIESSNPQRQGAIEFLCNVYSVETKQKIDPSALITKYKKKVENTKSRYPLLDNISSYSRVDGKAVAEYINAIDIVKAK
jgi:hypothetical protein